MTHVASLLCCGPLCFSSLSELSVFAVLSAYYAGYAEGVLSANMMSMWWSKNIIYPDPTVVPAEKKWVADNLDYMKSQIALYNTTDAWWFQAQLLLDQLQGLTDGYATTNPTTVMTFNDVYWSTLSAGDLDDMPCIVNASSSACVYVYSPPPPQPHLNLTTDDIRVLAQAETGIHRRVRPAPFSHCSGFVKFTEDQSELLVGHSVWDDFNSMMRIVKHYTFYFHSTADDSSPIIPVPSHLIASYPGSLISGDDYWVASSGLVFVSSEIGPTPDSSIYAAANIQPDNVYLEFFRQVIATRLSTDAMSYAKSWANGNSGTFNSEWLVIDYNGFTPGSPLAPNTVYYLAQIPGKIVSYDITDRVNKLGFAGTFNIPYDTSIYNSSGWPAMYAQKQGTRFGQYYADLFTYNKNPRYRIAERDHQKITDLESFQKFIRYNDYMNDELSAGPGTPTNSPWNAIAARADLVDRSSTADYPDELQADCFGGNDGKVISSDLVASMDLVSIVGPSADNLSVFSFSDNAGDDGVCNEAKYPHSGMPDKWDFKWVQTKWPIKVESQYKRKQKKQKEVIVQQ